MRRLAVTLLLPPALLAAAAISGERLEAARVRAGIPPSAARVPLGGFEPLAVTLLWLRQEELRQERRLSEAVAAIRLVTELEPRIPDAWALLGQLVAWQVSESSGDPEDQWRWAEDGIAVLRRGLEHNPGSPKIEVALGLVYYQRIAKCPPLRDVAERRIGRPPEAVALDIFRRLSEREPDVDWYRWLRVESATLLGFLLAGRGDAPGAIRALEEALPLWEEVARDPEAEQARKRLEEVRKLLEELRRR